MARNLSVTSFSAVTQARTSAIVADVILKPAIGIGDRHPELLLDQLLLARQRVAEASDFCSTIASSGGGGGAGGTVAQALVSNKASNGLRRMNKLRR